MRLAYSSTPQIRYFVYPQEKEILVSGNFGQVHIMNNKVKNQNLSLLYLNNTFIVI